MQLVSIKTLLVAAWVFLVGLAGIAGHIDSSSNWAILAGIAFVPALLLMMLWNDPPQTMSESIREARR